MHGKSVYIPNRFLCLNLQPASKTYACFDTIWVSIRLCPLTGKVRSRQNYRVPQPSSAPLAQGPSLKCLCSCLCMHGVVDGPAITLAAALLSRLQRRGELWQQAERSLRGPERQKDKQTDQ